MKKLVISLFAVVVVAFMMFTISEKSTQSQKPKVAATIYPIYDIARTIAGDDTNVVLLLPPGMSEHLYEPTASVVREAQGASIVFAIGQGMDTWADNVIQQINSAQKITVDIRVPLREGEDHHDEDSNETEELDEENHDPHYWLDPDNAIIIIDTIANYIAANDPEHITEYAKRAEELKKDIIAKDVEWKKTMETVSKKELITFHEAFGYFADHFGLHVVASIEPFPGKEPTPQYLADIINVMKQQQITTLYLEPQLSGKSLETFAKDNNITLGILDPVGGFEGRKTYIELIDYNVQTIANTQQ